MDVNNKLSSIDNKILLWNLLLDNNIFKGISADRENLVKKLFESTIISVSNENYGYGAPKTLSGIE